MKKLSLLLILGWAAFGQSNPSTFSGLYQAMSFNYAPLVVGIGNSATGAATITLQVGQAVTRDGIVFTPVDTTTPITVGVGSGIETVTPLSVSCNTPTQTNTCQVTANFSFVHGLGDTVKSGTYGLQEALNYAGSKGGGEAIVDAQWYAIGGTGTIKGNVTLPSNTGVGDSSTGAFGGGGGGGGSTSFGSITNGTNTALTATCSTGCLIAAAANGVISANQVNNATVPLSQPCVGSNGSGQLINGTCGGGGGGGFAGFNSQTGNYTVAGSDNSKSITETCAAPCTVTLTQNSPNAGNFSATVQNLSASSNVTIARTVSLINGGSTNVVLLPGQSSIISTDASGVGWTASVPEVAGTNMTITGSSAALTLAASGAGGLASPGAAGVVKTTGSGTTTAVAVVGTDYYAPGSTIQLADIPSGVALTGSANSYVGFMQTVGASSVNPAIQWTGVTADPSGATNGASWRRSDLDLIEVRSGNTNYGLVMAAPASVQNYLTNGGPSSEKNFATTAFSAGLAAAATNYAVVNGASQATSAQETRVMAIETGTFNVTQLSVWLGAGALTANQQVTVTLRVSPSVSTVTPADTTLTCTVNGSSGAPANQSCTDSTHTVNVTSGQLVDFSVTNTGSAAIVGAFPLSVSTNWQ